MSFRNELLPTKKTHIFRFTKFVLACFSAYRNVKRENACSMFILFISTGYPIDGILQVEEEEEENQSDNETYTIEDDVRQSRKSRTRDSSDDKPRRGAGKRSFPRPSNKHGGARPKEVWTRPTDFSKWSRSGQKSRQEVSLQCQQKVVCYIR